MASPIYGEGPKIRQEGDTIVLYDHGSWFTQDNTRASRFLYIVLREGGNVFGTSAPPQRTRPEDIQPGEHALPLKIGAENIGRSFQVIEYGGVDSPAFGNEPAWTEWGREFSGDRDDLSRYGARSNTITITDWRKPAPPPPPPVTKESAMLAEARAAIRPLVLMLRERGLTWDQVKAHPYGHAYYTDLGGK